MSYGCHHGHDGHDWSYKISTLCCQPLQRDGTNRYEPWLSDKTIYIMLTMNSSISSNNPLPSINFTQQYNQVLVPRSPLSWGKKRGPTPLELPTQPTAAPPGASSTPPLKRQRLAALGQLIVGLESLQLQLSIINQLPAPNHPRRWRAKESPRISSSSLQSRLSGLSSLASIWCVVSQLYPPHSPLRLSLPRASIKLHLKLQTCFSANLPIYKCSKLQSLTHLSQ